MRVGEQAFTVQDLIEYEKQTCRAGEELNMERSGRRAAAEAGRMNVAGVPASWSAWFTADPRRGDVVVAALTVAVSFILLLGSPREFDTGWPEVAAGVGAFVLVAQRRRWPLVLLAIAMAWTALHVGILPQKSRGDKCVILDTNLSTRYVESNCKFTRRNRRLGMC